MFFLWLPDVELAIKRVAQRVRRGGHDVPTDDVRRRFSAGLANSWNDYRELADRWRLYAADRNPPRLIAEQFDGEIQILKNIEYASFVRFVEGRRMSIPASDDLDKRAEAAFRVAALKVIEDARRGGTGIVIWRDGRAVEISCDEAEELLAQAEAGAIAPPESRILNPESRILRLTSHWRPPLTPVI